MGKLTAKHCVPCEGGIPPLPKEQVDDLISQVEGWSITEDYQKIEKVFGFKNFKKALEFVNKVGKVAEQEGHHPDIFLFNWNKVKMSLYTHAIGGLHENDFILAAKIDDVYEQNFKRKAKST